MFTETGQVESSIKVSKQRSYTGQKPVISSSLADTPCTTLGIEGVLDRLNTTLRTSYTLNTPSLSSVLNECIEKNDDFGTAYARLRLVWARYDNSSIQRELCKLCECEEEDKKCNHVVPSWMIQLVTPSKLKPISHAWVDKKDRVNVWTSINRNKWPVPIPKGASLELIQIEMLNLGLEYMWLDMLCLRQKGGPQEDLCVEEWKLDVPIIGHVYDLAMVVVYLSGLGLPLSLKDGDLDSDQCWFQRAWTVQEVGRHRIIAGDTPDGPMNAEPIDEDGNYETDLLTRFHKQLESVQQSRGLFGKLADMQKRVSTNPVDKVAGLAFPLWSTTIPTYYESESLEDTWIALVDAMNPFLQAYFLFVYPGAGLGCKKWRPTWRQIMTEPLPDGNCLGPVNNNHMTGEDWYEELCIKKGLVWGLDVGSAEECDRYGELVVEDADGIMHTFKIHVTHQCLIPADTYTLLGDKKLQTWAVGR
ncbi:hypothetical protein EV421DRAFT_1721290 [Armillaria borealis]|uniref:Heterokaryon incompatibility domain-containing protein n=1 Tax=Armillaria borealis TaxID=47425 RepID=A0AA39IUH2_9AGAR|nr:hypothetical protein EV421DRAFT_1721290 [Armillaria borealis]